MGRPSSYKPEYCQAIVDYFSKPLAEVKVYTGHDSQGKEIVKAQVEPNDLPLFGMFAISIDVTHETILTWCDTYPEFSLAYKKAKELQENFLVQNTLKGNYEKVFAIFTAKNILKWRDTQELTGPNNGPLTIKVIHETA